MTRIFCTDDVVSKKSDEYTLGVIERTHGDVDTHDPYPNGSESERIHCSRDIPKRDFRRFLKDGVPPKHTVLVRWQTSDKAHLIQESKLELVDRSLLIGDVVKKDVKDAMSGVILNTFTKCTIQPISDVTITGNGQHGDTIKLKGLPPATGLDPELGQIVLNKPDVIANVPASELRHAEHPMTEDLVVYKGWIGRIEETSDFISLKLSDNSVVEIRDEMARHLDGAYDEFNVGDVATTKKGILRNGKWIYGKYNPNTMPIGTVVAIRVVSAEISWLERRIGMSGGENEPPTTIERTELESSDFIIYDQTRRPQPSGDHSELSTVSSSDMDIRLTLRARFKDLSGACVKYGPSSGKGGLTRLDRKNNLGYDLNVFDVVKFQTDVTVQWQDLSITREHSIDLVPETGIDDEHDAWPGEIVHTLDLEPVDHLREVKQARRVGVVQSIDSSERMAKVKWCPDACVQYSEDEEAAGLRSLVSGVVGIADGEIEEVSLYDIEAPGELNVRRGDIVLISNPASTATSDAGDVSGQDWLGEIVDTRVDGTLTVRLGAASPVRDVNFRREDVVVAIRSDMSDQMDAWDDEDSPRVRINSDGEIEVLDESESEMEEYEDEDDEDSISFSDFLVDESDEEDVKYEDENGKAMEVDDVENEEWESASDADMVDAPEDTPMTSQSATPPDTSKRRVVAAATSNITKHETTDAAPEQYLILSTPVPPTHAFALRTPTTNPTHIKRVQKDHSILHSPSNLPHGVYVRTWESRLDLLRILFIGPEDTPYAHAPFVIDFYLPPTFPSDPPQASFHSWTVDGGLGGVGRVNPNLYEDGKICLSLLGTWESGKSSEGWMGGKSTVLQVIVSVLGLVLVKEPYFNEAGYEHLAGMESAKRASELYSERVYLKAKTFVIAALGSVAGTEGLEDVIDWLYSHKAGAALLEQTIQEAENTLSRSNAGEGMSKGACLSLRKVVDRLKMLPRREV